MIRSALMLLVALLVSSAFASTNPNVRQRKCAQPRNGCAAVLKSSECNTWHGCLYFRKKCAYDVTCEKNKPQKTVSPSLAPTIPCLFPSAGCGSLNLDQCPGFNGCITEDDKCIDGGCQQTRTPTKAPTLCIDVPPEGCPSKFDLKACEQWTCCTWIDNKDVCLFTPATEAPVPTPPTKPGFCQVLGQARCRKQNRCKWMTNRCVAASSG